MRLGTHCISSWSGYRRRSFVQRLDAASFDWQIFSLCNRVQPTTGASIDQCDIRALSCSDQHLLHLGNHVWNANGDRVQFNRPTCRSINARSLWLGGLCDFAEILEALTLKFLYVAVSTYEVYVLVCSFAESLEALALSTSGISICRFINVCEVYVWVVCWFAESLEALRSCPPPGFLSTGMLGNEKFKGM